MISIIAGKYWLFFIIVAISLVGCLGETPAEPSRVIAAPTLTLAPSPSSTPLAQVAMYTVPATWTSEPIDEFSSPTAAGLPSLTPKPSSTKWPTNTPTSTVTRTPAPAIPATDTPQPTLPSPPVIEVNLLPNPSFEEGWYHIGGLPELQVANHWTLEWDVGSNPLDPDPWNEFVRPESRVLNGDFLPEGEHDLFIWDGDYTAKIFKREGATSFRLFTNVNLDPGTYQLEINVFPDMIDGYTEEGAKIWAPDPLSAELRFISGNNVGTWIFPTFGERNTYRHAFQVNASGQVRVGVAFRGRWAIVNNGWFMDDWSLNQLSTAP